MDLRIEDRKKIAFPRIHHYNYAIKYIIEQGLEADYLLLPPATKETAELGSRYSPDYVCAPFKHTLGSLIEALEAGADILVETGGLCRLWATALNSPTWRNTWAAKSGNGCGWQRN